MENNLAAIFTIIGSMVMFYSGYKILKLYRNFREAHTVLITRVFLAKLLNQLLIFSFGLYLILMVNGKFTLLKYDLMFIGLLFIVQSPFDFLETKYEIIDSKDTKWPYVFRWIVALIPLFFQLGKILLGIFFIYLGFVAVL